MYTVAPSDSANSLVRSVEFPSTIKKSSLSHQPSLGTERIVSTMAASSLRVGITTVTCTGRLSAMLSVAPTEGLVLNNTNCCPGVVLLKCGR